MRVYRVTDLVWLSPEDRILPWAETVDVPQSGDADEHIRAVLSKEYGFEVVSFTKERITRAIQAANEARWLNGDTAELHRLGKMVSKR